MMKYKQFIQVEENINLWVETYGDKTNDACLLIAGAGANSSFWTDRLCQTLAADDFYVIKYDHRDIGYSTKIDWNKNPYDVMQLAKDAIAILDNLNIERSHMIGHSMGGFITQLLGIHYPERVLSITSASSSTNSPYVPLPPDETWELFMKNNPTNNYENDIHGFLEVWEYLNGGAEFDKELAIQYTKNLYERQEVKGAIGENHVKAQENLTDRTDALSEINIPSLIIHGAEDYLVDKYGGIQTAACIKNSRLVVIPEMGHIPFNQELLIRFENTITKFLKQVRVGGSLVLIFTNMVAPNPFSIWSF